MAKGVACGITCHFFQVVVVVGLGRAGHRPAVEGRTSIGHGALSAAGAQQGARRYGELHDLVHRREESRPNALWQADHAKLDILLLREDGATARPWLTAIIDDHSRAIAGYYLSFDPPSSFRTSLALRQGIWRKVEPHWQICVIHDVLYTDNGADFSSR